VSSTSFLARLLSGIPRGKWAAIRHDRAEVIGHDDTADAAQALAHDAGDDDPIVVKVPEASDSMLSHHVPGARRPPYALIGRSIANGGVVPFLGAGASQVGRPPGARFNERTASFLPNTSELAELLGELAEFPPRELPDSDLARVSSYLVWRGGGDALNYTLRTSIGPISGDGRRCQPGILHRFLAREERIRLILTTNYDTLIEDAFQDARRDYDLLVYPSPDLAERNSVMQLRWRVNAAEHPVDHVDPQKLKLNLEQTIIFKMHGSYKTPVGDSYIITEEHYLEFLKRMGDQGPVPKKVLEHLSLKSLWFLGYGLKDWNLRLLLYNLGTLKKSWAVQREASQAESGLWSARNVDIFEESVDDFVENVDRELRALRPDPPALPAAETPLGRVERNP